MSTIKQYIYIVLNACIGTFESKLDTEYWLIQRRGKMQEQEMGLTWEGNMSFFLFWDGGGSSQSSNFNEPKVF